jgi:hypothetical protein
MISEHLNVASLYSSEENTGLIDIHLVDKYLEVTTLFIHLKKECSGECFCPNNAVSRLAGLLWYCYNKGMPAERMSYVFEKDIEMYQSKVSDLLDNLLNGEQ